MNVTQAISHLKRRINLTGKEKYADWTQHDRTAVLAVLLWVEDIRDIINRVDAHFLEIEESARVLGERIDRFTEKAKAVPEANPEHIRND